MKFLSFLSRERILTVSMLIGAAAAVLLGSFAAFARDCEDMPQRLFRMHILANSDSEEDQSLKYALRDYLSEDMTYIFEGCATAEEAKNAAKSNLREITLKAQQFVFDMGYTYKITASVEKAYFTTRRYGSAVVPAGDYDALRIVIGSGEGKNWWCVMFPPLCLGAVEEYMLKEDVSDEELLLCKSALKSGGLSASSSKKIEESGELEIKFALYEWLKKLLG
ncbi:MAG: stage II sporulation protein R [Bacteroides sp.]|nr:stage II sporulation protein R [Bacteroides sp.]